MIANGRELTPIESLHVAMQERNRQAVARGELVVVGYNAYRCPTPDCRELVLASERCMVCL